LISSIGKILDVKKIEMTLLKNSIASMNVILFWRQTRNNLYNIFFHLWLTPISFAHDDTAKLFRIIRIKYIKKKHTCRKITDKQKTCIAQMVKKFAEKKIKQK